MESQQFVESYFLVLQVTFRQAKQRHHRGIPPILHSYHSVIVKSIRDQLTNFRAHYVDFDHELSDVGVSDVVSSDVCWKLHERWLITVGAWNTRVQLYFFVVSC